MKGPLFSSLWGPGGMRLLAGDLVVILVLALLSGIVLSLPGRAGGGGVVEVEISGRRGFRLPMADDGVSEAAGPLGATRVEVRDGRVRILSSPCPLKLCQRAGWIETAGDMIVCLPNEVVVRIPGRLPGGIDVLSR